MPDESLAARMRASKEIPDPVQRRETQEALLLEWEETTRYAQELERDLAYFRGRIKQSLSALDDIFGHRVTIAQVPCLSNLPECMHYIAYCSCGERMIEENGLKTAEYWKAEHFAEMEIKRRGG